MHSNVILETRPIIDVYKRQEVEMMKNGLIDVFNVPMTNHTERMNFTECRRTLKEILEGVNYRPARRNGGKTIPECKIPKIEGIHSKPAGEKVSKFMLKWKIPKFERTHNKIVCHNLRRSLKHGSIPEIEMLNKKPIITLTKEVQLTTSLINQKAVSYTHLDVYKRQ